MRRTLALAAAASMAAGLLAGCGSGGSDYVASPGADSSQQPAAAAPPATVSAPSSRGPSQQLPAGAAAPAAGPASPTFNGLQPGDHGPKVLQLQQRLMRLGFWLDHADGNYGTTTSQAVMAFQKVAGLSRDGVAGQQTLDALARGASVQPRTTSGHWLEIDKTRQIALLVTNGHVDAILNTSTGSNQPYQEYGQTYTAVTPSGQYSIYRQSDGMDTGPLGDLWRPKYFNGGIAIHGSGSIPGYPASHGCARVSNEAINWIWAANELPIGTPVLVY